MLHKWLLRLMILLILVLLYTYGIALVMLGVGVTVPKLPYLHWLGDPTQPWSLLLVTLGMQVISFPTAFAVAKLEQEMPLWLAFMIAVPAPAILMHQDWQLQVSLLGYALEPLVEMLSLPLWTWVLVRRHLRKERFSA